MSTTKHSSNTSTLSTAGVVCSGFCFGRSAETGCVDDGSAISTSDGSAEASLNVVCCKSVCFKSEACESSRAATVRLISGDTGSTAGVVAAVLLLVKLLLSAVSSASDNSGASVASGTSGASAACGVSTDWETVMASRASIASATAGASAACAASFAGAGSTICAACAGLASPAGNLSSLAIGVVLRALAATTLIREGNGKSWLARTPDRQD